mgnify:CR=1 FL=1
MLLLKLFFAFIQVGMFSVGGGYAAIPLIQEQIVNIYGLMTLEEFSDLITVAEMTPGPIFKTNEEMIDYIEHVDERFDREEVRSFKEKFMGACDGHATDRIWDMMQKKNTL